MTLFKAVEAARSGLTWAIENARIIRDFPDDAVKYANKTIGVCEEKLAALPDKPMTEDDIIKSVNDYFWKNAKEQYSGQKNDRYADYIIFNTVQALKADNVLYVKED